MSADQAAKARAQKKKNPYRLQDDGYDDSNIYNNI
jgi:hypothetical protein